MNSRRLQTIFIALALLVPKYAFATDDVTRPVSELPSVSPDGSSIAFISDATGTENLWISNRDGSSARPLIPSNLPQRDPDWDPVSNRIVFSVRSNTNKFDIWTVNRDGT